jgi:hypothetical protein
MPKTETFELIVPGTPEEVAARLRGKTRWRPFPYQGSPLGGRKKPLGGRVGKEGFRVALDPRDLFQLMQAVAHGKLEPHGEGSTRVAGTASLPIWMTWYLRIVYLAIAVVGVGIGTTGTIAGWPLSQILISSLPLLVVGLVLGAFSIGLHVSHADKQVPALVDTLSATLLGASEVAAKEARLTREPIEERDGERARPIPEKES